MRAGGARVFGLSLFALSSAEESRVCSLAVFATSLDAVDELVDFGDGVSCSILLLSVATSLLVLAEEFEGEVREEGKHAHVRGVDELDGVLRLRHRLDRVTWHQEEQQDPIEHEESDNEAQEANDVKLIRLAAVLESEDAVAVVARVVDLVAPEHED